MSCASLKATVWIFFCKHEVEGAFSLAVFSYWGAVLMLCVSSSANGLESCGFRLSKSNEGTTIMELFFGIGPTLELFSSSGFIISITLKTFKFIQMMFHITKCSICNTWESNSTKGLLSNEAEPHVNMMSIHKFPQFQQRRRCGQHVPAEPYICRSMLRETLQSQFESSIHVEQLGLNAQPQLKYARKSMDF